MRSNRTFYNALIIYEFSKEQELLDDSKRRIGVAPSLDAHPLAQLVQDLFP